MKDKIKKGVTTSEIIVFAAYYLDNIISGGSGSVENISGVQKQVVDLARVLHENFGGMSDDNLFYLAAIFIIGRVSLKMAVIIVDYLREKNGITSEKKMVFGDEV